MRGVFLAGMAASLAFFLSSIAKAEPKKPEIDPTKQPSGLYVLDPSHASLVWRVSHLGLSKFTARFDKVNGRFEYESKVPLETQVEIHVDANSISTKLPQFDETLKGENWLNAKKCADIIFKSSRLEQLAPAQGVLHGNLTFRCQTHPVILNVTFNGGAWNLPAQTHDLGFSAHGAIRRSLWGLNAVSGFVSDDVELLIEVEFLKEKK